MHENIQTVTLILSYRNFFVIGFIRFHRSLPGETNVDGPGGMCGLLMQASFPTFAGQDFSKNLKPADEPDSTGAGPYEAPPCQDGELNVHVQGIAGSYCAPKCDGSACPAAPAGDGSRKFCQRIVSKLQNSSKIKFQAPNS